MVQTLKKWRKFQKPAHFHNHLSSRNYINWRLWSHTEVFSSCRERGYILGLFAPISIISQTQAKALTSTRGRAANPQLHRRGGGIPECLSPQVLDLQLQEPGSPSTAPRVVSSALLEHFFPYMPQTETRTKSGGRWGRHKRFPQFSFLFFYRHRTAFCPTVLFFNLREKRVLVLITWLQFTWDRKKEEEEENKGSKERRGTGGMKEATQRFTRG